MLVIDDFAREPDRLVEQAAALRFAPNGAVFPGVRAPVPLSFCIALRQSLEALIQKTFDIDQPLERMESWYSLVTAPARSQTLLQKLPHIDGVGGRRIALVHHLGRSGRGGTAFYRHRATGFETVDPARLPGYNAAVNAELRRGAGLLEIYEQVALYPARYNRLLIYRGDSLHGAVLPEDAALTDDARTGRFSINSFIWLDC